MIDAAGNYYYVSHPPFAYYFPFFIFKILHVRPDVFPLQLLNLAFHFISGLFIYFIVCLLSFNRARSGDVFYHVKPLWIERPGTGSTHGSPYNYDTHVPLLWFGVGVTPGVRTERVGVDDLAPTLAHILGISAPAQSQGRILF